MFKVCAVDEFPDSYEEFLAWYKQRPSIFLSLI